MERENVIRKIKRTLRAVKRKNPFSIEKQEDGIKLNIQDTSFDPRDDREKGRVFLVIVDGMDTTIKEVDKHGDDMVLEYEDKYCAITSKPLLVGETQMYFTKDGFLGTMALNRDTLLGGDVFQQQSEDVIRKISKDVDTDKIPIDIGSVAVKEDDDYYYVKNDDMGDVTALYGSKKTLKDVNKAKRLRKLLKPSKMDKKQLLMAIGTGVALGFYLYPRIQG